MKRYLPLLIAILTFASCAKEVCTNNPSLETFPAKNITETSAVLSGQIDPPTCNPTISSQGFVYSEAQLPTINDFKVVVTGLDITKSVEGLNRNTTYYYRAFFQGAELDQVFYGPEESFKTEIGEISIQTTEVTDITFSTASSGGYIFDDGGSPIEERGICYAIGKSPTVDDFLIKSGSGKGDFEVLMENLDPDTQYQVRAYGINEKGIQYGESKEFKTDKITYEVNIQILGYGDVQSLILVEGNASKSFIHNENSVVQLTAIPSNNGERFVRWEGDVESLENPIEITVDQAYSITAVFEDLFFNIPDSSFEQALIECGKDTNLNGQFSLREALNITRLEDGTGADCSLEDNEIVDWTGLGKFENLLYIDVSKNQKIINGEVSGATTISELPELTKLVRFVAQNHQFETLDFSNKPDLKQLYIYKNALNVNNASLTSLNITNSENIEELVVTVNRLENIDLRPLKNLKKLSLGGSYNLEVIDVSENTNLNQFTLGIGFEHLPKLRCIKVSQEQYDLWSTASEYGTLWNNFGSIMTIEGCD